MKARMDEQSFKTREVYDATNEDTPAFMKQAFSVTEKFTCESGSPAHSSLSRRSRPTNRSRLRPAAAQSSETYDEYPERTTNGAAERYSAAQNFSGEDVVYEFRDDWTAQVEEEAIDPDRPIVDPHIHFFTENELFPRYVFADYLRDVRAHNIRQTVYVQCMEAYRTSGPESLKPVGETETVARIAQEAERGPADTVRFAAIIAGAQLIQGASVRETLEAHLEASPLVRGVRDMALWDESEEIDKVPELTGPNMYEESTFREGFAELSRLGLCFDAHQYHTQLSYVVDLARAFPDTAIVVDHLGSPLGAGPYAGKREEVFVEWRHSILELSTCENITMKLGGLAMPWCGFGFDEAARPPSSDELIAVQGRYYDHVLQCFGPNRCMFESNFPVDKFSLSYTVLWNSFKKMASGYSEEEKEALFGGTATRFYRLDPV